MQVIIIAEKPQSCMAEDLARKEAGKREVRWEMLSLLWESLAPRRVRYRGRGLMAGYGEGVGSFGSGICPLPCKVWNKKILSESIILAMKK